MDRFREVLREFAANMPATKDLLDLHAQQTMAAWAQPMFWATVASAALGLFALYGAYRTLSLTRKAIKDAREIGENQTQAYVHASKASFGSQDNVIVSCKNSGLTPATHFSVNGEAKIVKRGMASSSITFHNDEFKTWSSLGATDELTVGILAGNKAIRQFKRGPTDPDDLLLITGQIIYCTVFNHDHLTQFAFYVEPTSQTRFRRPTANLVTFWRVPSSGLPEREGVPGVFEENDEN
jgi:hypothetical protein